MIGTNRFLELVTDAFNAVCQKFSLSVEELAENEIGIQGKDFILLAWLDRDGLSIKYVDTCGRGRLTVIDVGSFLATKRTWMIDESKPTTGDFESRIRRSLSSYARTLEACATDILRGEKAWISEVSDSPMPLSEEHEETIRAAVKHEKRG